MLLVVNPNDPSSLQIANAYAALRDIPSNNILFIAPPADYQNNGAAITQSEVTNTYLTPIATAIAARGLTNQINYVGTIGQATCYSTNGLLSTDLSLNYALTLLTPLTNGSGLNFEQLPSSSYVSVGMTFTNSYSTGLYQNPANIPMPTINTSATWTITPDAPVAHAATYQTYFPYAGSAGRGTIATQYYMSGTIGYTGSQGNTATQVITGLKNPRRPTAPVRRPPFTLKTTAMSAPSPGTANGQPRNRSSTPAAYPGPISTTRPGPRR